MQNLPPSLQTALTEFLLFLPELLTSIVVFIITLVVAGYLRNLVARALKARRAEQQIVTLISNLIRWVVLVAGTITALELVNFDVTAFVAGLGVAGIAVGFALQDTLANFVAGILLLIQKPFKTGDRIETAGFFGQVEEVDLRATRLRTPDGKDVLIPNKDVLGTAITNWTLSPLLRIEVRVGVAYDSDLDQVERVSKEALKSVPGLVNEPDGPFVWFDSFNDSSIDLRVLFWIDTTAMHHNEAKDEAVKRIKRAYEAAGIEIPFPIRTVFLQKNGGQTQ